MLLAVTTLKAENWGFLSLRFAIERFLLLVIQRR
jgi:hypothetical protein